MLVIDAKVYDAYKVEHYIQSHMHAGAMHWISVYEYKYLAGVSGVSSDNAQWSV